MRLFLAIISLLMSQAAWAVPIQLNQHGRLLENGGLAIDGQRSLSFRIYDDVSSGSILWEETLSINFVNGYYAVVLGADVNLNPLNDSVLKTNPIYLEVEVVGAGVLNGRKQIVSTPYARIAGVANSISGGEVNATEIGVNGLQVINTAGEWVGPTIPTQWSTIENIPSDISDGDDNTLGTLNCANGELVGWNGMNWECVADNIQTEMDVIYAIESNEVDLDPFSTMNGMPLLHSGSEGTLSGLLCLNEESPVWDAAASEWVCLADEMANHMDVSNFLSSTPVNLSAGSTIGGELIFSDQNVGSPEWAAIQNVPSDLLDGDDILSETQVEEFVGNSSIDLAAGSSVNGNPILTNQSAISISWDSIEDRPAELMDGDGDTLAELNCQMGELVGWNGSNWSCVAQSGSQITESEVEEYITNSALDFSPGTTIGGQIVMTADDCLAGEVMRYDGIEWSCASFDSLVDSDADGIMAWDDCNDNDSAMGSNIEDKDCDGYTASEDCDDENPLSNTIANDADCDGSVTAEDCNDNNPNVQSSVYDNDCDGSLSSLDCDDNDPTLLDITEDADCDGFLTHLDCDDNDPNALGLSNDNDCDGLTTSLDCDDNDASSTAISVDNDCDGVINTDDCDDNNAAIGPLGGVEDCPAHTCTQVLNSGQTTDGIYYLDLNQDGQAIQAYCDQNTDGGGWMRVFGLEHDGTTASSTTDVDDTETGVELALDYLGALSLTGMNTLMSEIAFSSIRFTCSKPSVGTVVDIKSDNVNVIHYFTGQSSFQTTANAYSMTRLPEDNSMLGQTPSLWGGGSGKWGHASQGASFRSHPMYIASLAHWNAPYGSRYECDDYQPSGGSKAGLWEIYVR